MKHRGLQRLTLILWMLLAQAAMALEQQGSAASAAPPPPPFFEWNRCPFEGCQYGQWKAIEAVPLYSTWKRSRKEIGALAEGEKVVAVTGVVITYKPGVFGSSVTLKTSSVATESSRMRTAAKESRPLGTRDASTTPSRFCLMAPVAAKAALLPTSTRARRSGGRRCGFVPAAPRGCGWITRAARATV
jgi:hypothetical protein